jgi:hypothetical protein
VDGRKALAAGILVLATSTGCAPWGTFAAMGVVGGAAAEVVEPGGSVAVVERPKLGRVFRDGRYDFRPAPPSLQREADNEFRSDPAADQALKRVKVKLADDSVTGARFVSIAIVWSDFAAGQPATWEGFLDGYADEGGVRLKRGTLRGVEIATVRQPDATVVVVDYSNAVTMMVLGPPHSSVGPLKDLARYLLRSR